MAAMYNKRGGFARSTTLQKSAKTEDNQWITIMTTDNTVMCVK
jgi:hypothetical protein